METTPGPAKEEKRPLTRKEKIAQENQIELQKKINGQAARMQKMLCDRFFDYFLASPDPEGDDVQNKIKVVSAQWKMYCKRMNFRPESFDLVKGYCEFILNEYRKEKEGKVVEEEKVAVPATPLTEEQPKPEEPPVA